MMEIINILSAVLAISAVVYLFVLVNKCSGGLKKGFVLFAFGILVTIGVHSILSLVEMDMNLVMTMMSIQILIGSVLFIAGTYILYNTIKSVAETKKK